MLPDDLLAIGSCAHAHQPSRAVMRTPVYPGRQATSENRPMKQEKFACRACGATAISSHRDVATCGNCGGRYEVDFRALAKITCIAPLTLIASALTGAWWICILAIPLGVYLSHVFDRRGGKWRLIHAANQAIDTPSSASKTTTPP